MANLIKQASDQLREILLGSMGRLVASGAVPPEPVSDFKIEIPADKSHGDFATNAAMVCAKPFRMAPRAIAEKILGELVLEGTYFDRAEIAGPGFINFFLSPRWFAQVVNTVLEETGTYGRTDTGEGKRVLVEFVSANPTGPMHMGNARGGVLGDALASVLDRAGYNVSREFYVNDAGNQIEKFAASIDARYRQLILGEDKVEFPEDGYHGDDIRELEVRIYGSDVYLIYDNAGSITCTLAGYNADTYRYALDEFIRTNSEYALPQDYNEIY